MIYLFYFIEFNDCIRFIKAISFIAAHYGSRKHYPKVEEIYAAKWLPHRKKNNYYKTSLFISS